MVEIGDEAILLDLGPGFAGLALPAIAIPSTVRAVVVSHMHGDHHVDLIPLRNLLYYHYGEPRGIGLHLPRRPAPPAMTCSWARRASSTSWRATDISEGSFSRIGPFACSRHTP